MKKRSIAGFEKHSFERSLGKTLKTGQGSLASLAETCSLPGDESGGELNYKIGCPMNFIIIYCICSCTVQYCLASCRKAVSI